MQRIGFGYDIHKLVEGRKLFLGGIEIPNEKGLQGHSDADVLIHAICDAILGALGMGDIGELFPDTDKKYKDISSVILLDKVGAIVKNGDYEIENIDCNIHAEEPKMKNYKSKMRKKIATTLVIEEKKVNIKAKTNELMGPIGKKEAIAATAVVLIRNE